MAGLLDSLFATPNDQAMWALGSGLLGVRRGNEGAALQNAMQVYNQAKNQQAEDEYRRLRLQQMQKQLQDPQLFGKIDPSDFTTESLAKFQQSKNYGDLVLNPRNSKAPSSVLEWDFFSKLSPEEKEKFLNLKRSPQQATIGGVPHQIVGGVPRPLSSLPAEVGAKRDLSAAQASGSEVGRVSAGAAMDLPAAEELLKRLEGDIDALMKHPGRKWATGPASVLPTIPGTPQADFISRHNQLTSRAFLQAFETLKGGGPITEVEGTKATQAMMRMDRATTDGEYEAAAQDFLKAYRAGVEKLRNKARPQFPSGYADPVDQARAIRDYKMTEPVSRVPGSDPLGIR